MNRLILLWAVRQVAGASGPKAVLLALARRADDDGQVTMSIGEISAEVEISPRAIKRHLADLRDAGLVSTTRTYRPGGAAHVFDYQLAYVPAGAA